ncbi:MAG: ECF transporter S component [Actinomycetes bacterium]
MTSTPLLSNRHTVLARRPLLGWRTVDLVVAAMLGVAFGVAYWGWAALYEPLSKLTTAFAPAVGLFGSPWLLAAVVGAAIVRRPGAALLTEVLAATVEALLGNEWGWTTLLSGVLEGLGVEVVLALFLFRRFGWLPLSLGAALSAVFECVYEWPAYWQGTFTVGQMYLYTAFFAASSFVVAGLGGWALTRAMGRTGALSAFPAGQEAVAARG